MKISCFDFKKMMIEKLERDGGKSQYKMLKGGIMNLWLSENCNGIINDHFSINCTFEVLYAIYEMAISLGGKMYFGASAAQKGLKIGSNEFPVDTIDAFVAMEFYGKTVGEKTTRRSTYYAAILDWAGFVTNHWGGYLTVKQEYMCEG